MPDPERYMATAIDVDAALRDLEEVTVDTKTHERVATKTTPPRRRQWWIAVAAFVAVLAIGGGLVLAPFGGSGPEPGPATTVTQPPTTTQASSTFEETVAVVETFWATWNSGDIEATVALLDPDITVPGSPATFRSFMEHLAPQGGTWVVTNCSELLGEGSLTCHLAFDNALHEALGLTGNSVGIVIAHGACDLTHPPGLQRRFACARRRGGRG